MLRWSVSAAILMLFPFSRAPESEDWKVSSHLIRYSSSSRRSPHKALATLHTTTGNDNNNESTINDRPRGVRRNSGNGPRFFDVGFNLSKAFQLGDSQNSRSAPNVNFFIDTKNAFNLTNFGQPGGVMSSSLFGKPFSARNPREIEIGMRFQF